MGWTTRALAGPVLWAVLFALIYALHGTGCALGWTGRPMPPGGPDLHRGAMLLVWLAGLALHGVLVRALPAGRGRERRIITLTAWIGLVSTLFTLFPVAILTTCG